MRIVFANNFHYRRGGSEAVYFEEMDLLGAGGHEVAPFSRRHPENLPHPLDLFFPVELEYENVGIFKKISATFSMIYSMECKQKFAELLNSFKPVIIHAHNIYGNLTTSILDAARERNIPVVMTLHDYKLACPAYLMYSGGVCDKCITGNYFNCVLNRCTKKSAIKSSVYMIESYFNRFFKKYEQIRFLIAPSNFLANKIIEAGVVAEKVIRIPNFIDPSQYEAKPGGDYLLYAGRLSREKGLFTMLKAIKGIDIPVKIVGDGPLRKECEDFVSDTGASNVIFEGHKTGAELKRAFTGALAVVYPSECFENFPMAILEAFAYGKPVIGSNIGGIPEIIEDNKTGVLFQPGNHIELGRALMEIVRNPSKAEEMGRNAREKVEAEFSSSRHYSNILGIYNKAIGSPLKWRNF